MIIETGPQEAAAAAWDALTEAVERSKHIAPTGQAEIDDQVNLVHARRISRLSLRHAAAMEVMVEAMER